MRAPHKSLSYIFEIKNNFNGATWTEIIHRSERGANDFFSLFGRVLPRAAPHVETP